MEIKTYECSSPIFNSCTLLKVDDIGLCVIQQHFNKEMKVSWWGPLERTVIDAIKINVNIENVVKDFGNCKDGQYPVIEIRKLMWKLKMKPMKKDIWETRFF